MDIHSYILERYFRSFVPILWIRIRVDLDLDLDLQDPYVFGPPGSASGFISHKYGSGSRSGSGSFHHQAKIVRKTRFLLFFDFLMNIYQCFGSGFGS
jgi:hypothetical protein